MTLLAQLVATSARVAATSSRLEKIREIAACLRSMSPDEIPIGIAYLSGETCQGKLGVSFATLQAAQSAHASQPSLTLNEVNSTFDEITRIKGAGSSTRRTERLQALFARATAEEQDFLARLIVGELRQGALRGLMLDAIAAAAGVPPASVRRAAMSAGGLGEVARTALTEGVDG